MTMPLRWRGYELLTNPGTANFFENVMVSAAPAVRVRSRTTLCFRGRAKQKVAPLRACGASVAMTFPFTQLCRSMTFPSIQLCHSMTFLFVQRCHQAKAPPVEGLCVVRKFFYAKIVLREKCSVIPAATRRAGWRRFRCAAPGTSVPAGPPSARRPSGPRSWPCRLRWPWRRPEETPPHLPPC